MSLNTVIETTRYANKAQMYLRSALVSEAVCSSQFAAELHPGKTINFPYRSTVRVQDRTPSTNLTIDPFVDTADTYSIDQSKAATANIDDYQQLLSNDLEPQGWLEDNIGYELANNIDQYVISTGLAGSYATIAGGTLSASNVFELLSSTTAELSRNKALIGRSFAIVDPDFVATLANSDKANGFNLADETLIQGYRGPTSAGFLIYESNNLPYSVTLTMAATPTAGDTFEIQGKLFEFVANGTAAAAGEISLGTGGTALADTQASTRAAINGTGTPGASNYIDLSTYDRRDLLNSQVSCSAFSANVATITGYGKLSSTASFNSASNLFGTETKQLLCGKFGAIDLTVQEAPKIEVRYPEANTSINIIGETQFGAGVFENYSRSLVKITANA